jgi:flagellar hook protein FlgE
MLRSMYAAVSGMQAFETKLDVIGNNIANVNTTGFKASRVDFSDMLSQLLAGASAPAAGGPAGINPKQVGLGVQVAATPLLFTQGADQATGNPLDCAIDGAGLFIVSPDGTTSHLYYTRAGNFSLDADGNLTLNGQYVMGIDTSQKLPWNSTQASNLTPINLGQLLKTYNTNNGTTISLPSGAPDLQIGADGSLNVMGDDGARHTVGWIALALFPNPAGLEKVGGNLYEVTANSGTPQYSSPGNTTTNAGSLSPGMLEMSNVDLTREFTEMIVAQRGFDANSKVIGTDNAILNDIVNLKNS